MDVFPAEVIFHMLSFLKTDKESALAARLVNNVWKLAIDSVALSTAVPRLIARENFEIASSFEESVWLQKTFSLTWSDIQRCSNISRVLMNAIRLRDRDVIAWFFNTFNLHAQQGSRKMEKIIDEVALNDDDFSLIQWLAKSFQLEDLTVMNYCVTRILYTDTSPEAVIWSLDKFFPKSDEDIQKYYTTIHQAVIAISKKGYLEVLIWMKDRFHVVKDRIVGRYTIYPFQCAAEGGHLAMLKWMKTTFDVHAHELEYSYKEILKHVAQAGQLEVMKWFKYVFGVPAREEDDTQENFSIFKRAVVGGHVAILDWMKTVCNLPWLHVGQGDFLLSCGHFMDRALALAAENGSIEVMKWIFENTTGWTAWKEGSNRYLWIECFKLAAMAGHVHVLQWMIDMLNCDRDSVCESHVRVMRPAHIINYDNQLSFAVPNSFCVAAENGRVQVLQWLYSEFNDKMDMEFVVEALHRSIKHSKLKVTKWLWSTFKLSTASIRNVTPLKERHPLYSATHPCSLSVLKWLKEVVKITTEYDFSYIRHIFCRAAEICALDVVRWLTSSFSLTKTFVQLRDNYPLKKIVSSGDLDAVKWFVATFSLSKSDIINVSEIVLRDEEAADVYTRYQNRDLPSTYSKTTPMKLFIDSVFTVAATEGSIEILEWFRTYFSIKLKDLRERQFYSFRRAIASEQRPVLTWMISAFGITTEDVRMNDSEMHKFHFVLQCELPQPFISRSKRVTRCNLTNEQTITKRRKLENV